MRCWNCGARPEPDRTEPEHKAYFAYVGEAWAQLPEYFRHEFPTSEHLRKYALIRTGWCDVTKLVLASRRDALATEVALLNRDEYSVVTRVGTVVTWYTAKSQSYPKMKKRAFRRSSNDVRDYLASLIDTPREELEKQSKRAA